MTSLHIIFCLLLLIINNGDKTVQFDFRKEDILDILKVFTADKIARRTRPYKIIQYMFYTRLLSRSAYFHNCLVHFYPIMPS